MTKKHLQSLVQNDVFWLVPRKDEWSLVVNDEGDIWSLWAPIPCQVVDLPEPADAESMLIRAKNLRTGEHIFAHAERSHLTYEACVKALSAQMKALT